MGLLDKLKDLIGSDDEEYNEDEDFFPPDRAEAKGGAESIISEMKEDKKLSVVDNKKAGKVVNIHTTAQLQVILVKP
jgi:cell division inhibitor SepF